MRIVLTALLAATTALPCVARGDGIPEEFRVKREAVFEFARKPTVTRSGDGFAIAFESKGLCDVTVAIEDTSGRIIRHLASGVLGDNAPAPLAKGTTRQSILWDGKNDQGRYVANPAEHTVRVSLGLKPRYERSLLWSPHKQRSSMPQMAAAPEGVYVYDGQGVDHVRLFDHEGNYVRTVYPFGRDRIDGVKGLTWHDFPQGYRLPLKQSGYQQTLLTSGTNDSIHDRGGMTGRAAMGIAVRGKRIALAFENLNRLATDGTTGGLELKGPETGFVIQKRGYGGYGEGNQPIGPTSLAFSPDGRTVYLTGYLWRQRSGHSGCYHVVHALDYAGGEAMTVFAGSRKTDGFGKGDKDLAVPTSVDVDAEGRVYVSDFLNDRVQVYDASGRLLKSIRVDKPAKVMVHAKTGQVFTVSWEPIGVPPDAWRAYKFDPEKIRPMMTRFTAFPEFRQVDATPFPLGPAGASRVFEMGQMHEIALDSWAPGDEPVFWVNSRKFVADRADHRILYVDDRKVWDNDVWRRGIRLVAREGDKWKVRASFGDRAAEAVGRVTPIRHNIQHLYTHPVTGKLYVGEADSGATIKAFKRLIEIDPSTGAQRFVELPFNALDVAFDLDGLVYLRSTDVVARYNPTTWREVPWDYGEELPSVTCGIYGKSARVMSGLVMPTVSPVCFHQGGMAISPRGHLAVACANRVKGRQEHSDYTRFGEERNYGEPYKPSMYPGREESSTSCCIHVWDKHGRLVKEDAVQGLPQIDGLGIDRDDNIYVMATPTRILDGKRYFNFMSETLIKFPLGKGKLYHASRGKISLPEELRPKRPADLSRGGRIWADGAEWFYGGVGYAGFNTPHAGGGCACWFARYTLDLFARSIAPEPYQYRVAVLDSAGNLILRIGKYGNVDDGVPLEKGSGQPGTRSIGGDEVSLFHACFVGTHTDRRIFISDLGNARVISVKLDYHATETLPIGGE